MKVMHKFKVLDEKTGKYEILEFHFDRAIDRLTARKIVVDIEGHKVSHERTKHDKQPAEKVMKG